MYDMFFSFFLNVAFCTPLLRGQQKSYYKFSDYLSCMYFWQKLCGCISLEWFSAYLVSMPAFLAGNQKAPVVDIPPLKYYNFFYLFSHYLLNNPFKHIKKINWHT